jgi:hypothetical protein
MNLNFVTDPELAPRPRDEIRIEAFAVSPYPDGRRVRIELEMTPFAPVDRPNLEITVRNENGEIVGSLSVIESVQRKLSLTTHLREPQPQGRYEFTAELFYSPEAVQDSASASLVLPQDISAG